VLGSIHYMILPGLRRDELLQAPSRLEAATSEDAGRWWRPVEAAWHGYA
jgi:hypothetical protein